MLTFFLFIYCTKKPTQHAGGVTETGNSILVGKVVDTDNNPVQGALVKFYNAGDTLIADSIAGNAKAQVRRVGAPLYTDTTDVDGEFGFEEIDSGTYNVEVSSEDEDEVLFIPALEVEDDLSTAAPLDLGVNIIKPVGRITGYVLLAGEEEHDGTAAFIGGTSYNGFSDVTGSFSVNAAEGEFTITFVPTSISYNKYFRKVRVENITVVSDSATDLGIIYLERDISGPPARPDSLRAVYDTLNEMAVLTWKENFESDVDGYIISRANYHLDSLNYKNIGFTSDTVFYDYADAGAVIGSTYAYRVTARDTQEYESDPSRKTLVLFTGREDLDTYVFAGRDTIIATGDTFTVMGSVGPGAVEAYRWDTDADGDWEFEASINSPISVAAQSASGSITLIFEVEYTTGQTLRDTLYVTVTGNPPTASAGNDTALNAGDTLLLNGTGSDGSGSIVEYAWDLNEDGVFDSVSFSPQAVIYIAPACTCEILLVLRVKDDDGLVNYDTIIVTVGPYEAIPDSITLAYWKFDEGSGSTLTDHSGNGNHGTVYGAAWTGGRANGALSFDGVDDYVEIPATDIFGGHSAITMETWLYLYSYGNDPQGACVFGNNGPGSYEDACLRLVIVSGELPPGTTTNVGKAAFSVADGTSYSVYKDLYSNDSLPKGEWVHLVNVWDGDSLKMYINGQLSNSREFSVDRTNETNYTAYIGRVRPGYDYFIHGRIDELRILNYALSGTEVVSRYESFGSLVAPAADAGNDTTATAGDTLVLEGSVTSGSGDIVQYCPIDQIVSPKTVRNRVTLQLLKKECFHGTESREEAQAYLQDAGPQAWSAV